MITRFIIAGNFLQFYLILASNMYSYCIALFLDNDGAYCRDQPSLFFERREGYYWVNPDRAMPSG